MSCAARRASNGDAKLSPSTTSSPQTLPVPEQAPPRVVWKHHFAQALGIDAPFQRVELFISDRTPRPELRLLLIQRPAETGAGSPLEWTGDSLCFERVEGATTTFHVRAETPAGPFDWRFEWPARATTIAAEPVSPRDALLVMIGVYAEPSKPIAVGPADR